jgi:hypothetical protein
MGIVYKAMDERDGRIVALKVIRETEAKGDESATHVAEAHQRFQREADILRGLLHVNIVDFYEIGEEDGTPYLAMEFLEGQPLGAFEGRPWPETLPLLIQAANGMEYLSSRGIVHRDLSPDNVYVVEKGGERIVKLLDFGVAKLFEKASGSLTATGFFLGKVAYGSPEQLGSLGQEAVLDWRTTRTAWVSSSTRCSRATPVRGARSGGAHRGPPRRDGPARGCAGGLAAAPHRARAARGRNAREAAGGQAQELPRNHRPARHRAARQGHGRAGRLGFRREPHTPQPGRRRPHLPDVTIDPGLAAHHSAGKTPPSRSRCAGCLRLSLALAIFVGLFGPRAGPSRRRGPVR